MIGSLGPERLANKVRLLRSQFVGAVLIVEGETDARVYKRYVIENLCHIEVAHNKDAATRGLAILEQEPFGGVLVIVDADFQRLEGQVSSSPNLFLTDTHDLETMMLCSPALDKILTEFGSEEKITTLITQIGKSLREILLAAGLSIGYLRWLSLQQNLALKFEELEFGKFVNDSLLTDVQKLIQTVKNKSQQHSLNVPSVQKEVVALQDETHDPWQVCCGHDLLEILSLGLRKGLRRGVLNATEIKTTVIERDLRLAYESAFFQASELCTALQQWEAANPPFRFLALGNDPQKTQ
jgi:Protein of unknown function (DUF4435)